MPYSSTTQLTMNWIRGCDVGFTNLELAAYSLYIPFRHDSRYSVPRHTAISRMNMNDKRGRAPSPLPQKCSATYSSPHMSSNQKEPNNLNNNFSCFSQLTEVKQIPKDPKRGSNETLIRVLGNAHLQILPCQPGKGCHEDDRSLQTS